MIEVEAVKVKGQPLHIGQERSSSRVDRPYRLVCENAWHGGALQSNGRAYHSEAMDEEHREEKIFVLIAHIQDGDGAV